LPTVGAFRPAPGGQAAPGCSVPCGTVVVWDAAAIQVALNTMTERVNRITGIHCVFLYVRKRRETGDVPAI
jgi:hypothetical protein